MKALTIWQPWASLVMIGAKPYEFRRWDYRDRSPALEGQRIVIHAGARPIKEIEVDDIETPHKVKPDGQGVVRWTETLAPHQKVAFRIHYTLQYPSDFVTRRRAEEEQAPRGPAASPAPARQKLYDQIDMLEKSL